VTTLTDRKPDLAIGSSPQAASAAGGRSTTLWGRIWDWLSRPTRHRAIRLFRSAIQTGDAGQLGRLLDTRVAVVVEAGDQGRLDRKVVVGAYEASALLLHGMGGRTGVSIDIRSINGQAGFMVRDRGRAAAAVAVDFTGRRVTLVWIRLRPYVLRHWNRV
jgi:hypothetical protein